MTEVIRAVEEADFQAIDTVVHAAFASEMEARLVRRLRADGDMQLEQVAVLHGQAIGHIAFSRLAVVCANKSLSAVALAPLSVSPEYQRSGIGSRLVTHAHQTLSASGVALSVVLGHPEYYRRFGYSQIHARQLQAPYAGPSFMAAELHAGCLEGLRWSATYAQAFSA